MELPSIVRIVACASSTHRQTRWHAVSSAGARRDARRRRCADASLILRVVVAVCVG
jgi:hypothetical protein